MFHPGISVSSGRFTNFPLQNGVAWDDDIPAGTGELWAQQMEINNTNSTAHTIGDTIPRTRRTWGDRSLWWGRSRW